MRFAILVFILLICAGAAVVLRDLRAKHVFIWLRAFIRGDWRDGQRGAGVPGPTHVLFCFVDHFEPKWNGAAGAAAAARVQRWVTQYAALAGCFRDHDGFPPVHTFFFPEEEYEKGFIDDLVLLCRQRFGEIEVHLHHDDDTEAGLRRKLRGFVRTLVDTHDALPLDPVTGQPRWCFIHGNWALDNSLPGGKLCGVDNELPILAQEGCYADFTLPSSPSAAQTSTINSIYYAAGQPGHRKSHDTGVPVRVGGQPSGDLMIIQGPLGLIWNNRKWGLIPRIENADVRRSMPPTPARVDGWVDMGIHVRGRPEWLFVKVHTHGAPEPEAEAMLGSTLAPMFEHLQSAYNDGERYRLHYVSAREMYNIARAAEAGHSGDPGLFRDFIVARPSYAARPDASDAADPGLAVPSRQRAGAR
jgi:hypothetical protein